MRTFWLAVVAVAACDTASVAPDAAPMDAPVDAPADAPTDAPIDAPADAPVDARPLRCTETAARVVDVAPRRILGSAAVGETVYVTTYDPANPSGGSDVRAIAVADGAVTMILPTGSGKQVRAIAGWIYGTDTANPGSVWRHRPGQALETLVAGRPSPRGVVVDDTHVYWLEGSTLMPTLMRTPLAGGDVTPLAPVVGSWLEVDDRYVYSAATDTIYRLRKDNWFQNWWSSQLVLLGGLLLDDGELVAVSDGGIYSVRPPATGFTALATEPTPRRHHGLTLAGGYLWVASGFGGVQRVPRAGGDFEQVTTTYAGGGPVFAGPYLTWTADGELHRCLP